MSTEYYTQNLTFTSGFRAQISPAYMAWVGADQGYAVPSIASAFNYCELGCGDGTTLNLLATQFPQGEFVGVDFNGRHIEVATDEAEQAGLSNVRYIHASFTDLADMSLPRFDFMASVGTYGWLAPALQAAVREFVGAALEPNGLFAVEYIPVPGKSAIEPVWHSLQKMFPLGDFDGSEWARGEAVMDFVRKLVSTNAPLFKGHPSVKPILEGFVRRVDKNPGMLQDFIHNSLASGFRTRYFDEVSAEFGGEGLQFLGQVKQHSQDDGVRQLYPRLWDLISAMEQTPRRELAKDLLFNNEARLDLYGREGEKPVRGAGEDLAGTFTLRFKAPPKEAIAQRVFDLFKEDLAHLEEYTDERGFLDFSRAVETRPEVRNTIRWLNENRSLLLGLASAREAKPAGELPGKRPRLGLMAARLARGLANRQGLSLLAPDYVNPLADCSALECCVLAMQLDLGFEECEQLLREFLAGEAELVEPYRDSALADYSRVQLRKSLEPLLESGKREFYLDWGFLGAD